MIQATTGADAKPLYAFPHTVIYPGKLLSTLGSFQWHVSTVGDWDECFSSWDTLPTNSATSNMNFTLSTLSYLESEVTFTPAIKEQLLQLLYVNFSFQTRPVFGAVVTVNQLQQIANMNVRDYTLGNRKCNCLCVGYTAFVFWCGSEIPLGLIHGLGLKGLWDWTQSRFSYCIIIFYFICFFCLSSGPNIYIFWVINKLKCWSN